MSKVYAIKCPKCNRWQRKVVDSVRNEWFVCERCQIKKKIVSKTEKLPGAVFNVKAKVMDNIEDADTKINLWNRGIFQ